ncbi:MAG: asparagine synthase (glutamine-hydrolyzing) [Bacteroidetes bacterium]|nr:asparagine synthase (glutamine-hydrolyzing) [Bacteroidota bacterium]HET6243563.1 asparagine synthase (glutamine-hydrolyzing) [Bacteroidia bacterium]
MCGIAGIVNLNRSVNVSKSLKQMTSTIAHRGPDDEGFVFFSSNETSKAGSKNTPENIWATNLDYKPIEHIDNVTREFSMGLGHRRLSILDLSPAGHQPMCINNESIWITYNGEIYNFIELRTSLEENGYTFHTNTDTEVILNAYKHWGYNCVDHFNGMWAFVIYDKAKDCLFGSRDRLGVKPLYYYLDQNAFVFASEQKALVSLPFVKTGINPAAVFDYFVLDEIEYEEEGFFKNIIELSASNSFTFDLKTAEIKKWSYYNLPSNTQHESYGEEKMKVYSEKLSQLLDQAISLRLRSDVPVGTCLSGGLDSSAITAIATKHLNGKPLEVFTASFNEKNIDESPWAQMVVNSTGAIWNRVFPSSEELMNDLENLTYCQDIPIWSTSTYAQYRVMQLVKEKNIKVVLDGQGGDELFAGYPSHLPSFWCELLNNKKYTLFSKELCAHNGFSKSAIYFIKQYLKQYGIYKFPPSIQSFIFNNYFDELKYLKKDFKEKNINRLKKKNSREKVSLNGRLFYELNNSLLKSYLKCEDRCSMYHSVESRTPFADDPALIEFSMNLSGSYKIKNAVQKVILRNAVSSLLPEKIVNRRDKMGYVTPNNNWISDLKPKIATIFDNPLLLDFLDVEKIKKDFDKMFDSRDKKENGKLFKFISFAMWVNVFEENLKKTY